MGRRGPAKTPLKVLKGRDSWRARNRKQEPKAKGMPRRPTWLSKGAARVWRRIVPHLQTMEIVGAIDAEALARYCVIFAKWRQAEEFVEENGTSYAVKDFVSDNHPDGIIVGYKEYPQVGRAIAYAEQLLRIEKTFGMNPGARANLVIETEKPEENRGRTKGRFFGGA